MDIRRSEKIFRARCRKGGMRFGKMVGVVVYLYVRITPEGSLNLALSRRPPPRRTRSNTCWEKLSFERSAGDDTRTMIYRPLRRDRL